jgi:hypothetical protein
MTLEVRFVITSSRQEKYFLISSWNNLISSFFFTLCLPFVLCQQRPVLSKYFEAKVFTQYHETNHSVHHGEGSVVLDQPNNKGVEILKFPTHSARNTYRLQRYDLGFDYNVDLATNNCTVRKVSGNMPDEWAWLANATYKGRRSYKNHMVDVWNYTMGYASLELGVWTNDTNIPAYLFRNGSQSSLLMEFVSYQVHHPNPTWFAVPKSCPNNATGFTTPSLGCVSRSDMISRAQAWVNAHVPYNQDATHDGYREDCSGYVSMAWESSKPGHTTFDMHEISHAISKGELQPGDALLCESEHVVLFGGWIDSDHYTAYEETRPGEGTVKRATPYPYWYNTGCFLPYRYNSVC